MKISIIGTGELGGTIAQLLAEADWPGELWLIGQEPGIGPGKALDLLQANPIQRTDTRVHGSHELRDIENSSYILIADQPDAPTGWALPRTQSENILPKKREVSRLSTEASGRSDAEQLFLSIGEQVKQSVVLLAMNNSAPLMSVALSTGMFRPDKIVGTSPSALSSRWRTYFARALQCSPQDVSVALLGAPPGDGLYEVFGSVAGEVLEKLLSPAQLRQVAREVLRLPAPGPYSLAAAAACVLRDMLRKRGAVHSCYVWSGGTYGARNLFLCSPAVVGPEGLRSILELPLDPVRRVTVDRGLDYLARMERLRAYS